MKRALLTGMVLACSASAAAGQQTGIGYAPPTVARKALQDYAWCTVRREPALAHRFVILSKGEQLSPAEFQRLHDGRCLVQVTAQLGMRLWQSQAALAEALLIRDRGLQGSTTFSAVPALDWTATSPFVTGQNFDAAALSRLAAEDARNHQIARLGECVARADPAGAVGVLKTNIDTDSERKRFTALAPRIALCVQQGQTRNFNRTNLRAGMALAYYRLAVATAAQGKV
ncbi:hypothetical protein GGQ97_002571 [Sphingomonas kaistensis]|uniref:Uncharacterized protein n=1 Tax=Sphingomonas kaistensis TaxID=298708 RepID=A0A7X5Y7U2_9SPHN|nr:hypothetical protein [Sphingomonas kaistensis]NJC06778.1 hypothetical protein [Sphingomonas kaistensis]